MVKLLMMVLALGAALATAGCEGKRVGVRTESSRPSRQADRTLEHEVQPGQTLAGIADAYYGDPDQAGRIAADNGIAAPERLAPGSRLVLSFSEREWEGAGRRAAAMVPYNEGVRLMEEGKLEEAERAFGEALAEAPDFSSARYNLALLASRRGRLAEARRSLEELVQERPREPDFLFALGHVHFQEGDFPAAVAAFDRLLAVSPRHLRGAFGRARALQEAGRLPEARAAWEAYLKLDGTSGWADAARQNLQQLGRGPTVSP